MNKPKSIYNYVNKKIDRMFTILDTGEGKANMALLRKGLGKIPGEIPQLFGAILEDMPEEFLSDTGIATKEEWACYIALTMFAWHQQGHNETSDKMHTTDPVSMGTALRRLSYVNTDENSEERMLKRLQIILTSNDVLEFSYQIRNVIKLLSTNGIALNYALLAQDIYLWQFQNSRNQISLKWGQDFYKLSNVKEENNNE